MIFSFQQFQQNIFSFFLFVNYVMLTINHRYRIPNNLELVSKTEYFGLKALKSGEEKNMIS
jgi:hypothetical protein